MQIVDPAGVDDFESRFQGRLNEHIPEDANSPGQQTNSESGIAGDTTLQVAPMATPPASAAFAMSAIDVLPLRNSVLNKKVLRVAPDSESTVLTTVCGISSRGTMALQKLGQNSHNTIEPSIAKRSEVASDSIG